MGIKLGFTFLAKNMANMFADYYGLGQKLGEHCWRVTRQRSRTLIGKLCAVAISFDYYI